MPASSFPSDPAHNTAPSGGDGEGKNRLLFTYACQIPRDTTTPVQRIHARNVRFPIRRTLPEPSQRTGTTLRVPPSANSEKQTEYSVLSRDNRRFEESNFPKFISLANIVIHDTRTTLSSKPESTTSSDIPGPADTTPNSNPPQHRPARHRPRHITRINLMIK